MGVAPRSEAMEKYVIEAVVNTTKAIWWKSRAPRGLCREWRQQFLMSVSVHLANERYSHL